MDLFGYPEDKWLATREAARKKLIEHARRSTVIAYSDLARDVGPLKLDPHSAAFAGLLDQISSSEDAAGHGMLTVLVVHKAGDRQPGPGFFELAASLGRDTSNIEKTWVEEFARVLNYWQKR